MVKIINWVMLMGDVYLSIEEQKIIYDLIQASYSNMAAKDQLTAKKLQKKLTVRINRRMAVMTGACIL